MSHTRMSEPPGFQEAPQQDAEPPLVSAAARARVGAQIGDYEIRGVIGEDETGVLYSGRHAAKGGEVTLKILHDRCARKKDLVEQFIGETRAARPIRHRNVVDVTDLGLTPEGTVFLVMEYLPGESLRNRLRRVQRLPPFEALNVMRQAAHGLGVAHDAGIVHGALKTDNIFLCKHEGRRRIVRRSKAKGMRYAVEPEASFDLVKLLDFGVARLLDPVPGEEAGFCGTLQYLSPEQAQGQRADQRSDIYSLGVVFYEMVTGTVPFCGDSLPDILRAHALGVVIPPSRRAPGAGIDARIDALILRCLKKSPPLRLASTGELCAALDACITDCAFLRDAHRLPGITESGIDLSEGLPQARQEAERSAEPPAAAPVAEKPAAAPVPQKPAVSPMVRIAPPVAAKPALASFPPEPAAAPIAEKPAMLPSAQASAEASTVDDPAAATIALPPVVQAEDPAASMITPPPVVQAEDPAAAMITPPPVAAAADTPADLAARADDQPSRGMRERPESISNVEDRPTRLDAEADVRPGRPKQASSHRSQVLVLVGLLLLGGGIAVWTARGGWVPAATKPVTAPPTAPVPMAAPPPPPLAAAPVTAPAAPAAPTPSVAAPSVPAGPAKLDRATTGGSGKHASSRARATSAKRARRAAHAAPVPSPTAPVPAAEPMPESEPPAPSTAAPEPAPVEPANAEDLLGEAQRTRKRGHFAAAISRARAALEAEPTPAQAAQAYELIGICACSIGDASAAREAAAHLAETKRDLVKAMCEAMGQKIE